MHSHLAADALAPFPPAVRRALLRQPRPAIEDAIERLIAYLDALDGDVDREPEPDEDDGAAEPEDEIWPSFMMGGRA